jgi:murein DD-endopeptidase MepM/ murein hydrolase activator NlpD
VHKAIIIAILAALIAVAPLSVARAQESSTTTSTTSGTGLPGTPTTSPGDESPDDSTTTTVDPDEDHASDENDVRDEPPPEDVVVPEAPEATTPGGIDARIRYELVRQQQAAQLAAVAAQANFGTRYQELVGLRAEEERIREAIGELRSEARRVAGDEAGARERFVDRAVNAYMAGPGQLAFILEAGDPNELLHRAALTTSVLEADREEWEQARQSRDERREELGTHLARLTEIRGQLVVTRTDVAVLRRQADHQRGVLAMFRAGSLVGIAGFVFPVGDPHHFVDTFGAPRMVGTQYEHAHEGTDIFAPHGTELYAVERGVVARVGTDVLGGTKLWLTGASGVRYYYAHLSGYAEGIIEGSVVEAGDVVGYVGNTGNARSTPPHLHFEVHPGGGMAVNPYPILSVTDRFRGEYSDFA